MWLLKSLWDFIFYFFISSINYEFVRRVWRVILTVWKHVYTCVYFYMKVYLCVCVCLCVCMRDDNPVITGLCISIAVSHRFVLLWPV